MERRTFFADGGTGLGATYFNAADLTNPVLTRIDPTVNFNFGTASPAPGVAPNTYSVRWTGQVQPRYSETYTFHTTGNDGVRLWVNGRHLVDDWRDHGVTENAGRITLHAGERYDIRMEYYQNVGGASAVLEWSSPSQPRQVIPSGRLYPQPTPPRDNTGTGLLATFYNNTDFTDVAGSRTDAGVDFDWDAAAPINGVAPATYSIRWTGQVQPRYSETYTFHGTSGGAMRIRVNGEIVHDGFVSGDLRAVGSARADEILDLESSQNATWYGQPVAAGDVLSMHTYAGDANLDGFVDGGDYAYIDAYVGSTGGDVSWLRGDFNRDGSIDGGDYAYIDVTVGSQPLPSGAAAPAPPAAAPGAVEGAGEITLMAGQKYDIEIEYAHLYGGGAAAKLEWSAASQPREVIPASRLIPPGAAVAPAPPASVPGAWEMIFRDEFEGNTLGPVWHTAQYWDHDHTIVGEGEVQVYDPTAVSVGDGLLRLTARKQSLHGMPYSSGLVQTGGDIWVSDEQKFSFLYGYMEVRAKLPTGQGFWPAIWMMPASHDDDNGELDVLEVIGSDPTRANFTLHRHGIDDGHEWVGPDFSQEFHTFGVDWQPTYVAWYVDGVERARTTDPRYICPEAMYPILNVALGGDWGGAPDASTVFPQSMDVDYVRVWQRIAGAASTTAGTSTAYSTSPAPSASFVQAPSSTFAPADDAEADDTNGHRALLGTDTTIV